MLIEIIPIIDLNIIVLIFLSVILLLYKSKFNMKDKLNKVYCIVIITTMIIIFLEILDKIVSLSLSSKIVPIAKLINICGFALSPVVPCFWLIYILESFDIKADVKLIFIPILLNIILCAASYNYGYIFSISSMNEYKRGTLFYIPLTITYYYLIISVIVVYKNKTKVDKKEYINLILFELIALSAGIIQIVFSQVLVIWSSVGVSIIIYYIYLQEKLLRQDSLTGIWNRFTFESYVNNLINKNKAFSLILIDLDDFKSINDRYGHDEGDIAIKNIATFLKNYFKKEGIVARMGGDEFVVILEDIDKYELKSLISNINDSLNKYNESLNKKYSLKFSIGYDEFNDNYDDLDTLMKSVDIFMYRNKNSKKI
ncbi:GGDEF domain-containing protein [Romboutsia sp.]|uniref:GGDEF domain-containing protein n=1 Tax=Romboutsia sp. TaxID=1965302 RepID=UPI003F3090FC